MCDVLNIAFFDEEYPYNLPVTFGYEYEKNLTFYCHHATAGHKNHLVKRNPKVCVVTHRFKDRIYNSYDGTNHDYRSVMAFGEMSFIDSESDEYKKAWQHLCTCNGREVPDIVYTPDFKKRIQMSKIVCLPENVYGKAQREITSLDQIPLKADPKP